MNGIYLFVLILIGHTFVFADIKKVITKKASESFSIIYTNNLSSEISLHNINNIVSFQYNSKNLYIDYTVLKSLKKIKIKQILNPNINTLFLTLKGDQVVSASFLTEINPIYYNYARANLCKSDSNRANLSNQYELTELLNSNGSNIKYEFLDKCDEKISKRTRININSFLNENISNYQTVFRNNNFEKTTELKAYTAFTSILSTDNQKIVVKCGRSDDPNNCGHTESLKNSDLNEINITLYPNCFDHTADGKCRLTSSFIEELLHAKTKVGNEEPDHTNVKKISKSFCDKSNQNYTLDPLDVRSASGASLQDGDNLFAKTGASQVVNIDPQKIPTTQPIPDRAIAVARTTVPNSNYDITLTGNANIAREHRELDSSISSWGLNIMSAANNLAKLASRPALADSGKPSRATRTIASDSRDPLQLESTPTPRSIGNTNTQQFKQDLVAVANNNVQPNTNSSELGKGTASATQTTQPIPVNNRQPTFAINRGTNQSTLPTSTHQPKDRVTDAAKANTEFPSGFPKEIVEEYKYAANLGRILNASRKNPEVEKLNVILKNRNIQIITLANGRIGQTDTTKSPTIYRFTNSGSSTPRLVPVLKIQKQLPTEL